ncbi:UvrD-helicase domain-containing protein [Terrimonas sp. NA20]|uniref:DNA 3'-5' helicase n=1 Tax=Terrimonas ginsenosidimutans TaxID=2908004 RepID=A0ABS9KKC2_9BACT|nr:UvrD-helicase domain-containing protein [Terrimonas ginsenosidimutans]MCG2612766.1 UvrD-helicase domain-containing protein [Terrimonas ginsenosidimutans]
MRFIIAIIAAIAGYLIYLWTKHKRKKQADLLIWEAKARKHRLVEITGLLPEIQTAVTQFFSHTKNYDAGYFANYELNTWRTAVSGIYEAVKDRSYDDLGLDEKDISTIKLLFDYYKNGSTHRDQYNQEFISQELIKYSAFFDNVEKRKLDDQQRTAIVTDEDNNLIIAGAGSGKTTTIVGKVTYLIDRYKVSPDQILLISFTSKSASTLAGRINVPGVEAKTFHKFGKDVIAAVEQKQPSIFDEKQFQQLITGFFTELLRNPAYLNKVTTFFTGFLKIVRSQDEFKTRGEYVQYLKDQNFSTYKTRSIQTKGKATAKREVVKSIEECKIGNYLFFNNVEYEYEFPYKHDTATQTHRQYKPDFTINPSANTVYLEHFGINKNGKVAHFFADKEKGETTEQATKKYTDGIEWKRELHKTHGTTLIETFSHEMFDNILFENLAKNLTAAGVQIKPKSPEEIWEIISASAKDEVDSFTLLFQTFITLMKSNNYSIDDVKLRNDQISNKVHRKRNELFIEIIDPIYQMYQTYLAERKEIDFSDMINKAASYIATGRYQRKLSYVIIDEFQDISIGRYQLVKAIKDTNPSCKLFCVGDDWQSIYRFSGSDITLFKEFEKYFGHTEKAKIETTYRFYDPLINLSSSFILKNPNQTKKQLKGFSSGRSSTYKITYSFSDNQDDTFALRDIFNELIASGAAKGKEILVLGRYSFDIDRIKNEGNVFTINKANETISYSVKSTGGEVHRLSAQFMTVHKSKGLEADIVIVINCNSGKHGFPSGMSDDPVLNLLLSDADQFENGEERRLFYVAMTRAKELVYFVADSSYKSKFIAELEVENVASKIKKCPRCKTADLVKRTGTKNGKEWAFYGCTNFMYGCRYQEWAGNEQR